jgi:hypothetical protein
MEREFTLEETIAIDVMCNERRTLQARFKNMNIPGWEYYTERFNRRFGWRPVVARLAAIASQKDPLQPYQSAGRTWSHEDSIGYQFTTQESDIFAMEFLAFEQEQQNAKNVVQQQPPGQQVFSEQVAGQRAMAQQGIQYHPAEHRK